MHGGGGGGGRRQVTRLNKEFNALATKAESLQVAAALEYAAQKCKPQSTSGPFLVNLEGNHFGDIGHRLIKGAVKFGKTFAGVRC